MSEASCFICDGPLIASATPDYRRCTRCGHELLARTPEQAFIVNDVLSASAVARASLLDRFQGTVLHRWSIGRFRGQLVDIGSGSGKFVHLFGGAFTQACGIEITPDAVNFSRNTLGLKIVGDIAAVEREIAIATAWHSLEHFPPAALTELLTKLATRLAARGCVIVSVPNAASFQYKIFRSHYAFFDVPSHLHQFTPESLARLFRAHGFAVVARAVSWPYNIFGYAQALLNCAVGGHNHLYYRLKRGRSRSSLARDVASLVLLPLVVPVALALGCVEAAFPARQGVLTWCFEKRP